MSKLKLASWGSRFWALLIDIIFIEIIISLLFFSWGHLISQRLIAFLYWILMDGYRGQSIGKIAMNIRIVDEKGKKISYATAGIESFGKSFLLPIDVLIGWIINKDTNQRLFSKLAGTFVIENSKKKNKRFTK